MAAQTYADFTDHKKIYKNTTWGKFTLSGCDDNDIKEMEYIVKNRNDLVKKYKIAKYIGKDVKYINHFIEKLKETEDVDMDSMEVYKLEDGRVLVIISPFLDSKIFCGTALLNKLKKGAEKYFDDNAIQLDDGRFMVFNKPHDKKMLDRGWAAESKIYPGRCSYGKIYDMADVRPKKTNKEYLKTYYEKHKELSEKQKCPVCGQDFTPRAKASHVKTRIHRIFAERQQNGD